jgi:hypothetical protein
MTSTIGYPLLAGHLGDDVVNAVVGPATADISAQAVSNLFVRRLRMLLQECGGCDDEAGCAESALLRIMIDEGLLYGG